MLMIAGVIVIRVKMRMGSKVDSIGDDKDEGDADRVMIGVSDND